MTQTRFGEQACQTFRSRLDSYIDNELLIEGNVDMIEHFRHCPSCTQEAQERRNVRRRLKDAVRELPVPPGLEGRIRDRLRETTRPAPKKLFLMAIAAALAVCFGVFRFQASIDPVLQLAFDDHLDCAVIHQSEVHSASEANELPEQLKGLTSIVQERVPSDLPLILAHECQDHGRNFIHLTFGDGQQHLLSVVITRKENGESLGNRTRQAVRDNLHLAAFETSGFFVYTVSDLTAQANASILAQLSPAVQKFLTQVKG